MNLNEEEIEGMRNGNRMGTNVLLEYVDWQKKRRRKEKRVLIWVGWQAKVVQHSVAKKVQYCVPYCTVIL